MCSWHGNSWNIITAVLYAYFSPILSLHPVAHTYKRSNRGSFHSRRSRAAPQFYLHAESHKFRAGRERHNQPINSESRKANAISSPHNCSGTGRRFIKADCPALPSKLPRLTHPFTYPIQRRTFMKLYKIGSVKCVSASQNQSRWLWMKDWVSLYYKIIYHYISSWCDTWEYISWDNRKCSH